jgi:signal transduction histidine kinase
MLMLRKTQGLSYLNTQPAQKVDKFLTEESRGKAILSQLNLDQLLNSIVNFLSNGLEINRALIMLVNEHESYLEFVLGAGFGSRVPDEVRDYRIPLSQADNVLVRVTNTGRPEYVLQGKRSRKRKKDLLLTHINPTSVYVIPLMTRFRVIGVIAVDAVGYDGGPEEYCESLKVFAQQISLAIENASLHRRLKEQDRELKKSHAMLSRAQTLSFLGDRAARLAHEIRNPMTAIQTFVQMLPRKFNDEEFRKNFYEIVMEETTRVNSLITGLLDLVRTKKPGFAFNDLNELIDKMIFLISPQSNAKEIQIIRDFDHDIGLVWVDSEKIKQVMLNLLSNAVEFSNQGGQIEVLTRQCTEIRKPRRIHIEVKDNGMGIDASMIARIFDPYFTFKHRSDIHKGIGLGLFISRQSIKELGGAIEVKSQPDQGTTFLLTLPVDPPHIKGQRPKA